MTHAPMMIDPSGRPLKRPGFEAIFAIGLLFVWTIVMGGVFSMMGRGPEMAEAVAWPMFALMALTCFCWWFCEIVVGRWRLIWPGSALGIVGPLSLGFALALSTPELRGGPFLPRLSIISMVAGMGMIPFLFRFKLPGLVSPIITFSLVGLFLELYGADQNRLMAVEGFSPRGIVAALLNEPHFVVIFGVLGLFAAVMARRLDMDLRKGNFGLAAARPLHLIGVGVTALVSGRLIGMLPGPLDLIGLTILAVGVVLWTLRINRMAVGTAAHLAMTKPLVYAITVPMGVNLDIYDWSILITAIVVIWLAAWPFMHKWSANIGWTLGPGGTIPPDDREGWIWRYWPYAGMSIYEKDADDQPDAARDRIGA
ncbi:MAG: hypothetical protein AAGE80_09545 [Pseudomonadota bacterium]